MKKITITIVTANFYPEDTAIGLYTTQLAENLSVNYNVNIITGFPYYPKWEIFDDYKNKEPYFVESYKNIKIFRSRQFVPNVVTILSRLKMIFSFVNGATKNLKQINQSNLVICIVPFTFSIFPAYWLAKKTKSKLWIHIQDFEFDLAFESGILSKQNVFTSLFKYLVFKIESYLLNKANVTSSISQQMLSKITEKSKDNQPFFFPNWISEEFINPDNSKFHNYFQPDTFNILYSGNVGEKQDWDLLIETAQKLENYSNIVFIIVGSGTYIEQLKFKTKYFKNIIFKDLVPYSELNDLLCSASLHFLFQKKEVLDTLMPSKLLGMMASKVPCIVTGHEKSEISKILTSDTGIYLYNPTASLISEKIIELSQEKEKSKMLGENARTKIIELFSKAKVLNSFNEKINAILNN